MPCEAQDTNKLKNEFEVKGLAGPYQQNIWVMAAAVIPFAAEHIEIPSSNEEIPTHTIRMVLRTTDEDGTNEYVDGTDLFVQIDAENQEAAFVLVDLWAEGPPVFHGGTLPDALRWVCELSEPFHIQLDDPYLIPEHQSPLKRPQ